MWHGQVLWRDNRRLVACSQDQHDEQQPYIPCKTKLLTTQRRLCAMNIDGRGCYSATFNLHGIWYRRVCGKIIGYQQGSPDEFVPYNDNRHLTIDEYYVDGISLTHGHNPRKHILWTFTAAIHERITVYPQYLCPCTNINNPVSLPIPPYVGGEYFCMWYC